MFAFRKYLFILFWIGNLVSANSFSQEPKIDSLLSRLKAEDNGKQEYTLSDTVTVALLSSISSEYIYGGQYNVAREYVIRAGEICDKLNKSANASCRNRIKYFLADVYNSMGVIFYVKGDYGKAIEEHFKSLRNNEEISNFRGIGRSYNNLGMIFDEQGDQKKALNYYFIALKNYEKHGLKRDIINTLLNIGIVYGTLNENDKALVYFKKGLSVGRVSGNKRAIATALTSMGTVYVYMTEFDKALEMYEGSLKINTEIGDKRAAITNLLGITHLYLDCWKGKSAHRKEKEYEINARARLNEAKVIAKAIGQKGQMKECYLIQTTIDSLCGDFKSARENYKVYLIYRDSLNNEENTKREIEAEMNYEFEKKLGVAKLLREEKELIIKEEHNRQKIIRNTFIATFGLMAWLAIFVLRSYRLKRKANKLIAEQKKEVEEQKMIIELRQEQIMESINYAKIIQDSILVREKDIRDHLSDCFVLYLPKDIVSGDFYWFAEVQTPAAGPEMILVAADCTGHGVPGAFLSMVGSTLLNEIITHNSVTEPSEIIKQLSAGVSDTLANKEKEDENTDGMDISVCKINYNKREILFAGANHTLFFVNQKGLQKMESQISSINGIFDINKEQNIVSENLKCETATMFYMTTDGYADQLGERTMKKFMTSRFEKLITEIFNLPCETQKAKLAEEFKEWKGKLNQVDDVLIIGFRI